jgi:hypothetical protein
MLRASGRTAEGLALVALGRPVQAAARFDAAAAAFPGGPEARLNAAEWRVIPPALGMPGFGAAHAAEGRRALAALATDTVLGHRAAWALAVDALARGDTAEGHRWAEPVHRSADSAALAPLLDALELAANGRLDQAVLAVAPAAAFDSAGIAPDPFLRSAVHLGRGEWLRRMGKPAEAGRDWLWHENTDTRGWPDAELQPAEVDWALSTWARWRRAELARASGDRASACALAARVAEIWNDTEPAVDSVMRLAGRMAADCRG